LVVAKVEQRQAQAATCVRRAVAIEGITGNSKAKARKSNIH